MRAANFARRCYWRLRGTTIYGVTALAFTPDGKLILIRQTYSPGWGLPGGGRRRDEDPVEAGLRELREEIGLVRWTGAQWLRSFDQVFSGVPGSVDLIRVEGVEFAFRPNLEIESLSTVDLDHLPDDVNRWSLLFIDAIRSGEIGGA